MKTKPIFHLVLLSVLLLAGCSSGKTEDEGSGTRGGGDACEVDVHHHLGAGYDWIADWGVTKMRPDELERFKSFSRDALDKALVKCSDDPITLDGLRKSAFSQQLKDGSFTVQIDERQWFTSKAISRTALAVHEVLVMMGIEQTNDYHLSMKYSGGQFLPSWVDEVYCMNFAPNQGLILKVTKDRDYRPQPFTQEPFGASLNLVVQAETVLSADLGKKLECYFDILNELNFTCVQTVEGQALGKLALEFNTLPEGFLFKIYWENLDTASLTRQEFLEALKTKTSFVDVVDGPVTSILLGKEQTTCQIDRVYR